VQCGGDLVAMYVNQTSGGNMYYTYTDQVGSILTVTDGTNTYNQSFDAWGNYRSATDGSYAGTPPGGNPSWLYRGFTGHEHLAEMQLINANGRLYDPFINSMLSPDAFVQAPTSTQNYNRYNYCLNNPLKYTDPSGFIYLPISAHVSDLVSDGSSGFWNEQLADDSRWNTIWNLMTPPSSGSTSGSISGSGPQTGNTGPGVNGMGSSGNSSSGNAGGSGTGQITTFGPIEGPPEYTPAASTYTVAPEQANPSVSGYETLATVYVYGTSNNTFLNNVGNWYLGAMNGLDHAFNGHSMAYQNGGYNILTNNRWGGGSYWFNGRSPTYLWYHYYN